MILINRPHTDPYFNIAAEEYILKAFDEDVFMLWQNEPSIIVGKHQNTLAEINYQFVKENNIPVIRRISGGGTVFHDLGNLNFSFIKNGEKGKLVDFKRFTDPIVNILNEMGVPAKFEGKNDLRVNGLKISGNAEHVFKNRVLHHGTLLFSSDLSYLNKAIKVNAGRFEDRAVKSNRSMVANITDFMNPAVVIENFKEQIIEFVGRKESNPEFYSLTGKDILEIDNLVTEKYSKWSWNFGYSPKYSLQNSIKTEYGIIVFNTQVENGMIKKLNISGDGIDFILKKKAEQMFTGTPHSESEVNNKLQNGWQDYGNTGLTAINILKGLF